MPSSRDTLRHTFVTLAAQRPRSARPPPRTRWRSALPSSGPVDRAKTSKRSRSCASSTCTSNWLGGMGVEIGRQIAQAQAAAMVAGAHARQRPQLARHVQRVVLRHLELFERVVDSARHA